MTSRITVLAWILAAAPGIGSAQTLNFTLAGSIQGRAEMIHVNGANAYITTDKTLTIFDVSNPAAVKRLGSYTFPEKIWGFRLAGDSAFVAADVFGLGILDVSDPAAPRLRGSFKTPGQAKNVSISGSIALVTDHISGVDMIDISDPAKPVSAGSIFLDGFARDVAADGSLAYAVDMPNGFYVLDLSKRGVQEPLVTLQAALPSQQVEVLHMPAGGPTLAVGAGGALQIFDVSRPSAPVKLPPFRTAAPALRVALKGSMAYVAAAREGLQVVDLSNPSNPRIIGGFKTASPARSVAVHDAHVFVALFSGEVVILRQVP